MASKRRKSKSKRSHYSWAVQKLEQKKDSLDKSLSIICDKYFGIDYDEALYTKYINVVQPQYDINSFKSAKQKIKSFHVRYRHHISKQQLINWSSRLLLKRYKDGGCNEGTETYNRYYGDLIGYTLKLWDISPKNNQIIEIILYYLIESCLDEQYYSANIAIVLKKDFNIKDKPDNCSVCLRNLLYPLITTYHGRGINLNRKMNLCGLTPMEYVVVKSKQHPNSWHTGKRLIAEIKSCQNQEFNASKYFERVNNLSA